MDVQKILSVVKTKRFVAAATATILVAAVSAVAVTKRKQISEGFFGSSE